MKYNEALKKIRADKPKDNFLCFELAYDRKLLLPYKAGMEMMTALGQAELLMEKYGSPSKIAPLEKDTLPIRILPSAEYERLKIAQLLGVSISDLEMMEESENRTFP